MLDADGSGGSSFECRPPRLSLASLECTLTTSCNLACSYCHQDRPQGRLMSWTVLQGVIDRLLASEAEELTLALGGGEPLLEWPLACQAIEYTQESSLNGKPPAISLTTNGLLLDQEKARFLVDHNVEVQISLDGIREAHELRAPGTFDVLDSLLVRLRRDHPSWYRKRLSLGMTLTSANLPFLSRSVEYLLGRGIESLRLGPLLTHDEGWGREAEAELDRQMQAVFECCLKRHRRTGAIPLEVFRRPSQPAEPRPARPVCRVKAQETEAVGVDGSVTGCPLLLALEVGGTQAGSVIQEWITRPDWPGLRRDRHSSHGQCRDCDFVDECLVCPVASANIPGNTDPRRVPDSGCAFNRILGRYRRLFPPIADVKDHLKGNDPLPTAMTDLAQALGLE